MNRAYTFFICFLAGILFSHGQTSKQEVFETPEKTGGVYYAYPSSQINKKTPVPTGYEAFYISHLGRHGSRYLISDEDYKWVINLFEDADKQKSLTPLGKDVLDRLHLVWKEAEYHGGDLSPLGVREQRGIAERAFQDFPQVFTNNTQIRACATTIVRCALSMDAFCERLKELNPTLQITRESSMKYQRYLNHHTAEAIAFRSAPDTWREEHRKFEEQHVHPERLVKSLFSDSIYVIKKVDPKKLMWGLFSITSGMQNIETQLSFYDLFEKEELFDLWQCKNYKLYVNDANSELNGGIMFENCKPLLKQILTDADAVIGNKGNGADLRFAHDGNIIPLAMLLHIQDSYNSVSQPSEFYKAWSDFKVAPMAGNIQIVFFKNKKNADDIIVKFLLHENEVSIPPVKTDIAPYYHWKDIKEFYLSLLNEK